MDGARKILGVSGASAVITLLLVFCGPAHAARFTLTPGGSAFSTGAGPFDWSFETSSNPNGYEGWVGYKLNTEETWHRCVGASSFNVQLSNLSDGTYSIDIADDVNEDYLAANGTFNSSLNTCANPSLAPPGAISQDAITIDSTPPTVSAPQVSVFGQVAQVSVNATDSGTGVSSYTWFFGDGSAQTTSQPSDRYSYLGTGTFQGEVIVADGAGNQATRSFNVTILPPSSPTAPGPVAPPTGPATHPTALRLSIAAAREHAAQVIRRRIHSHPRVTGRCTRVNSQTAYCQLTWHARSASYRAAGRIWDSTAAPLRLHYVLAGTRVAVECHSARSRCVSRFRWRG